MATSETVMIKQEPLGDGDVEAQTPFVPTHIYDVKAQPSLGDGDLLAVVSLDEAEATWSTRRSHAPSAADGLVDHARDELVPLEIKDESSQTDALVDAADMTSPMATSDVARFDSPHQDMAAWIAKPVSPQWSAARLHDTMATTAPPPPRQPLAPGMPLLLREIQRQCSIHGCTQATHGDGNRCPRHAGGRLCVAPGCTKNMQSRGFCIRHGGGRRCDVDGCPRGAQTGGKCKAHGGGVRCKAPNCTRSSQGSGLCRTHGGGKLCDYPGCKKGTQRYGKCSAHGGARRCRVDGCEKVDRGGGFCGRHKKAEDDAEARKATALTTNGDVYIKTENAMHV